MPSSSGDPAHGGVVRTQAGLVLCQMSLSPSAARKRIPGVLMVLAERGLPPLDGSEYVMLYNCAIRPCQ